ncbi:right-handed parallel beta-helix repeat-containing protein [Sphingomonas sp.]|uniref:right-handed parallel beta-helix repeat-containing protein n=1 Tax=Sphingomonas sp. TaxID=28214 RepID=UPI0028B0F053|nr:right-handed parallel beta-helix repeat-containing protein [Sphingomonas sp.]
MPVVKNQSELDAAIKKASSGDVILLAPGTYSSITMTNVNPAANITIQSLDTSDKGRAKVGVLWVTNSSNVTLKGFDVIRPTAPADDFAIANRVLSSSNITIDNVKFSGGTGDPTYAVGLGLSIRGGTNNKIINSTIDHFKNGMDVRAVNGMLVKDNNFLDNRIDHTNFSEMTNVTIDGNRFEGLYPQDGDHPDAIQFMTAGRTSGNSNVVIRNNVVMTGNGRGTQGFFLNDENGAMPYKDITIENNLIYLSGMYHGINLRNAQNATVANNTVISAVDEKSTWIRLEDVSGTLTGNLTDQVVLDGTNTLTNTNNTQLVNDLEQMRRIYGINQASNTKIYSLLAPGIGYQPPAGSRFAAEVASDVLRNPLPTGPRLLLDLNFGTQGVVDTSGWGTSNLVKPLTTERISNGMLNVSTGSGMELARGTSRQLYNLSAFTLNFDLQRAGANAPTGQIIGIYNSWNVTLRADGGLTFTMTNDAGVTSTMATASGVIGDTNLHKIALSFQGDAGVSTLYVDGVAKATAKMSGVTRKQESWGLYVGHPFTAAFSGSVGDIEMRDTAFSASQIISLNAGSAATKTPTAADTLKGMVAKGVAQTAATLAGSTAWGGAMAAPATLSLVSAFGTSGASASPLATALATASASGSLYTSASPFSMLTTPRLASLDLFHA